MTCYTTAMLVNLLLSIETAEVRTSQNEIFVKLPDGHSMTYERTWDTNYYWCPVSEVPA